MAAQEYRRVANQMGYNVPERDRMFGEALRRLLLKVVAMIEDYYGLRPINSDRRSVTTR